MKILNWFKPRVYEFQVCIGSVMRRVIASEAVTESDVKGHLKFFVGSREVACFAPNEWLWYRISYPPVTSASSAESAD